MLLERLAGVFLVCVHALPPCMSPSRKLDMLTFVLSSPQLLTCLKSADTVAGMLVERSPACIHVPVFMLLAGFKYFNVIAEVLSGGHGHAIEP